MTTRTDGVRRLLRRGGSAAGIAASAAAVAAIALTTAAAAAAGLAVPAPARAQTAAATGDAAAASAPAASAPATSAPAASAGLPVYTLDAGHTFVHWEVLHMGTSTIHGRFERIAGNVQFDPAAQRIDLGITIDTASVSTAVAPLDGLLRGAQMLDAAGSPKAYFVAGRARWNGAVPSEIPGELTLRGVTQAVTLKALRWKCGFNPLFKREVCGGDFEGEVDRSVFGITHSLPFVADRVRLLVQVEAVRQ